MKVLHKYEVGIIMSVGALILPLSMDFISFRELTYSKCILNIKWPSINASDA